MEYLVSQCSISLLNNTLFAANILPSLKTCDVRPRRSCSPTLSYLNHRVQAPDPLSHTPSVTGTLQLKRKINGRY